MEPPDGPSGSGASSPARPPRPMPPAGWFPAAAGRPPDVGLIVVAVVVILGAFAAIAFAMVGFMPSSSMFSVAPFLCIPVIFVVVALIIAFAQGANRRSIPPPPPIQQPMVPAGQQGPIALNCPNCGGPPTNVDRFGIATCSYCGTRFLVR